MRIEGYGRIRFGGDWPSCFDLSSEPAVVAASTFERPLEQIVQVRKDDGGDRIGVFLFRFSDNMPLPEGWQNGEVIYDSRDHSA